LGARLVNPATVQASCLSCVLPYRRLRNCKPRVRSNTYPSSGRRHPRKPALIHLKPRLSSNTCSATPGIYGSYSLAIYPHYPKILFNKIFYLPLAPMSNIEPADLKYPTILLVGTKNKNVMNYVQSERTAFEGAGVQVEIITGLNHQQEFSQINQIFLAVSSFLYSQIKG